MHMDGNERFILYPVEAGADLMATTRDHGRNVLHLCAAETETDCLGKVKMLLDRGMDLHAQDNDGKTALHLAVEAGNLALTRMLLEKGADVFIQDNLGRTALMVAASLKNSPSSDKITDEDQLLLVDCLLNRCNHANPCDRLINLQDKYGLTVLHYAVYERSQKLVHEILDWKPEVTTRMRYNSFTALHLAVDKKRNDELDVIKCLIEHEHGYTGDKIDLTDGEGRTVLHLAIMEGMLPVVKYLCNDVGMDVRVRDDRGYTALHRAADYCGADYGASTETITTLLRGRHGLEAANIRSNKGKTALHDAILEMKSEAVFAIGVIADVNIPDDNGKTSLHYAVQVQEISYVDFLLGRMADISVRDREGHTALSLACASNFYYDQESKLSVIYHLYKHGVAYGTLPNMV